MEFWKAIDILSKFLEVILVAAGVLSFIFRGFISEWIKHHFSKAVGQELQEHRHKLMRELEAYKAALIHDVEHDKANIDIKRTIAIKMADARLDALRSLYSALDRFCNECASWPSMSRQMRQHNANEFHTATTSVRQARREAEIFLSTSMNAEITTAMTAGSNLVAEFPLDSDVVLPVHNQKVQTFLESFVAVFSILREQIYAGPAELEEPPPKNR